MDLAQAGHDPEAIAIWFVVAYAIVWFYIRNNGLWLLTSSALCVAFLWFAFDITKVERAALPPVSMLLAVCHWGLVYFCLVARN